jgi:hypothetical protein
MPLQTTQKNDVFETISNIGLDHSDFEWADTAPAPHGKYSGQEAVLIHRPSGGVFNFLMQPGGEWGARYAPGDRIPRGPGDTLEVVRVRHDDERDVLVVRSVRGSKSD